MFIFFVYRHISYRALFAFLQGGTLVLLPCTCVMSFDLLACTLIDALFTSGESNLYLHKTLGFPVYLQTCAVLTEVNCQWHIKI
jgi:hypothetical protein